MRAIACVSCNWKIGNAGKLIYDIPEDRRMFRYHTTIVDWSFPPLWYPQKPIVIMGRKTYESLPNKMPLPDRVNWILSNSLKGQAPKGFDVVSLADILRPVYVENPNVWVIGGGEVYDQLAPYCSDFYITTVNECEPNDVADTSMVDLIASHDPNVQCVVTHTTPWHKFEHNGAQSEYNYTIYHNIKRVRMCTSDEQAVSR